MENLLETNTYLFLIIIYAIALSFGCFFRLDIFLGNPYNHVKGICRNGA